MTRSVFAITLLAMCFVTAARADTRANGLELIERSLAVIDGPELDDEQRTLILTNLAYSASLFRADDLADDIIEAFVEAAPAEDHLYFYASLGRVDETMNAVAESEWTTVADGYDLLMDAAVWRDDHAFIEKFIPMLERAIGPDDGAYMRAQVWVYKSVIGQSDDVVPPGIAVQGRADAHANLGYYLQWIDADDRAIEQARIAESLEPFGDGWSKILIAETYYYAEDFGAAERVAKKLDSTELAFYLAQTARELLAAGAVAGYEQRIADALAIGDEAELADTLAYARSADQKRVDALLEGEPDVAKALVYAGAAIGLAEDWVIAQRD